MTVPTESKDNTEPNNKAPDECTDKDERWFKKHLELVYPHLKNMIVQVATEEML